MELLVKEDEVMKLPVIPRWIRYKELIKEAARRVRNSLLVDQDSHYSVEQIHVTMARLVSLQDVKLAKLWECTTSSTGPTTKHFCTVLKEKC